MHHCVYMLHRISRGNSKSEAKGNNLKHMYDSVHIKLITNLTGSINQILFSLSEVNLKVVHFFRSSLNI